MIFVSFNINSIRARPHQLIHLRDTLDPDIIGLQETKVDDPEFPLEMVKEIGYHPEFWGGKGHYGVALLSKVKPTFVQKGFETDTIDDQKRFIHASYPYQDDEIHIMNGYFPQGENRSHEIKFPKKVKFYSDLNLYIQKVKKSHKNTIVMGDFNVAPSPNDIGLGEVNAKRWLRDGKCAFLPEEIEMWESILQLGYIDSWRYLHPETDNIFSWFDYRSRMFDMTPKRGLRIDQILVSDNLKENIHSAGMDYIARALEKPSDHCPVWLKLK